MNSVREAGIVLHPRTGADLSVRAAVGIALVTLIFMVGLAYLVRGARLLDGAVTPRWTSHDFGEVEMSGGLVTTRFPLDVRESVVVTGLDTT